MSHCAYVCMYYITYLRGGRRYAKYKRKQNSSFSKTINYPIRYYLSKRIRRGTLKDLVVIKEQHIDFILQKHSIYHTNATKAVL